MQGELVQGELVQYEHGLGLDLDLDLGLGLGLGPMQSRSGPVRVRPGSSATQIG
ncbi:hypothetical protein OIU91_16290 [Streptomyces sp. NBC_01456]|uniref:hypothetical protein n=1 Tax=unclassified Streptomyces TaxID=2593676 RepID=UPI002E37C6F8|nr:MULTISPECIES: hypothetical protein [unclassified Streptomyces]